jgi:predicted dithiol-disulfide oxidoreductase (DUF899 family)
MTDASKAANLSENLKAPKVVDRATFHAELDALRFREKAPTHERDAIAAARRRLPIVEVDGTARLIGKHGPVTLLDAFQGRRTLGVHVGRITMARSKRTHNVVQITLM